MSEAAISNWPTNDSPMRLFGCSLVSAPKTVNTLDMARQDKELPLAELRKRWERGLSKMPKVTSQQAYEQARQAALGIVARTSGERSGKSRSADA